MFTINNIKKIEINSTDNLAQIVDNVIFDSIEKTKPDTNVLKSISPKQKLTWYFLPTGFTPNFDGKNDIIYHFKILFNLYFLNKFISFFAAFTT